MGLLTDLDNNLNADDAYSGFDRFSLTKANTTPSSSTQVGSATPLAPPPPTQVTPMPTPRTPQGGGYTPPPRVGSPTTIGDTPLPNGDDGMSTEPVDEGEYPMDEGMGGYGGGGGGGGMPPEEEPMEEEMMRMEEGCKIMNIDCKIFYGLLIALAVGGYYLYSRKTKVAK